MKTTHRAAPPVNILLVAVAMALTVHVRADQNLAGNVTITGGASSGNLTVTGNIGASGQIDSDSNVLTFGAGTSAPVTFTYADQNPDTFTFALSRTVASWLWINNSVPGMRLDSAHQLVLYQSNGTTAGITLTPASNSLSLGTATLTASGTTLTTNGALTVGGNFINSNGSFTGGSSGLILNAGGTNQNVTLNSSGGDLIFNTNGTERARIKNSGFVGIGTPSPNEKLHVNGAIQVSGASQNFATTTSTAMIDFANAGARILSFGADSSTFGRISFYSAKQNNAGGYYPMTIDTTGNVGIGTTSPSYRLEVAGRSFAQGFSVGSSATDSFNSAPWYGLGLSNVTLPGRTGQAVQVAGFYGVTFAEAGVTAMAINNGNVGIGTTTPTALLQVGQTVANQGLKVGISGNMANSNAEIRGSLAVLGNDAASASTIGAVAYNYYNAGSGSSWSGALLEHLGTSFPSYLNGLPAANQGALVFQNVANGVIASNGANITVSPAGNVLASFLANGTVGIGTTIPDAKLALRAENVELSLGRSLADGRGYARIGFTADFTQYTANNALWDGAAWQYVNPSGYGGVATRFTNSYGAFQFDTALGGSVPAWNPRLYIANGGNIGIGTTSPTHLLSVKGTIRAQEVIVDNTNWADYVFDENYALAPLSEVEAHIKTEKHLPGIPSTQEIAERGVSMGEMQAKLLEKIEELTLHQIAQEKRLNEQAERIGVLEQENARLRAQ